MRIRKWTSGGLCALVAALACASDVPGPAATGRAVVWGCLKLVPPAGSGSGSEGAAYGDRRLRDAQPVDYSRPGFAVVYLDGGETDAVSAPALRTGKSSDVQLTIRSGAVAGRLSPRYVALGQDGRVVAQNRTDTYQVLTSPSLGLVKKLAPGESVVLEPMSAGEHPVHLLGATGTATTLFVAPGPFATVSASGRFVLKDLAPGVVDLRTWHPRLPPRSKRVAIARGEVVRQDFEVGVGLEPNAGPEIAPTAGKHEELGHASN